MDNLKNDKAVEIFNNYKAVIAKHGEELHYKLSKDMILAYKKLYKEEEPAHTHDFIEIAYICEGSAVHCVNNEKLTLNKGDMLIMDYNVIHSFIPNYNNVMINILISPICIDKDLINSKNCLEIMSLVVQKSFTNLPNHITFSGIKMLKIETLLNNMVEETQNQLDNYDVCLSSYVKILFVEICRELRSAVSSESNELNQIMKFAPEIIAYIQNNYDKKMTLSEVAKIGFYNPSYFSYIFKKCFNKTLTDYINEIRIEKSIELLQNTELNIEEIYYKTGFSDKKYFYAVFKKQTGKTPKSFREDISHSI